jgi:hypothetical protein
MPAVTDWSNFCSGNSLPDDPLDDLVNSLSEVEPLTIDLEDDDEPAGPPLTPEEIDAARMRLARWQPVRIFSADVKGLCNRCTSPDYFLQPQLKFLHDAYVLAKFARKRNLAEVCLAPRNEVWPDGYIKFDGHIFNIEVTSTHGDRKLGEEYRHVKGWQFDPVENWVARADSIPKYLDEAIRNKVGKNYGSPCWLVVYLNISEYDIRQSEIEQVITDIKARYAAAFVDISILWKGKLY